MHVRRALALALAVPLLLAGCTEEEPTPNIPDPTTSSPTSPPPESETPEAESAEDFIRRWVEASDEMQVTGETADYSSYDREIASRADSCADRVEQIYDAAERFVCEGLDDPQHRPTGDGAAEFRSSRSSSAPTLQRDESQGANVQTLAGGPSLTLQLELRETAAWSGRARTTELAS